MMHEKHMLNFYWAEVASTTIYLMNQCTTNGVHELTPYEILVGRKPIMSHLKVFLSIPNVRIPNEKQQKLDTKSKKCVLVGYSPKKKAYKCLNPLTQSVWVSWDIVFNESASWYNPDSAPSELIEEEFDVNSDDDIRLSPLPKDSPSSNELCGPHEIRARSDKRQR